MITLNHCETGGAAGKRSANRNLTNRSVNPQKSIKATAKPQAKRDLHPAEPIPKRVEPQT